MAGQSAKVDVVGLRDLQKAARQAGAHIVKEMRIAQKDLAEGIVKKARSRANSLPGKAPDSFDRGLKAKGEQRAAKITLDANRAPTVLGDEFGSHAHRQFQPWRGNQYSDPLGQNVGYALHPVLREEREHVIDTYERLVEDTLRRMAQD